MKLYPKPVRHLANSEDPDVIAAFHQGLHCLLLQAQSPDAQLQLITMLGSPVLSLTADLGVASLILAWTHTYVE